MKREFGCFLLFLLLLLLCSCTSETRRAEMRQCLQALNERNRADSVLTATDRDEAQTLVSFFDRHGTSNEQVLAHYLLGRCYADMHEAPMALHCYQEAISRADTAALDCDFVQLSRVYGQSATIFYQQGLYRNQLEYSDFASSYAWRGEDTLAAIQCYAMKAAAYSQLQLKDSAILIYTDAIRQLKAYKYNKVAAGFSGTLAKKLIDKDELSLARNYLQDYEKTSGYFDLIGNIEKGREIYYNFKGMYFLKMNQLDSAEYYFRKELLTGKDFNNQNCGSRGLALLYQQKHIPDSAAKYFAYSYAMNDSCFVQMTTHEIEQAKAMYDYTRQQELAQQESHNAARANNRLLVCIIVLLIVLLAASWLYIARRRLIDSLEQTAIELNDIKTENKVLKQDALSNQRQITENEKRIKQLEKKLGRYGKLVFLGTEKMDNDLKLSSNYQHIKGLAYKGEKLSECDWDIVCNIASEYYPGFYDFLLSQTKVDSKEYQICLLLRLHFKAGEIANMLGVTPPYISKTSTDILETLYGKKGSSKELSKELGKIN